MIRETIQTIHEANLVTLVIKSKNKKTLIPTDMIDNDGYQTYTAKSAKIVADIIASMGIERSKDGKELVLNGVSKERIPYYADLITRNMKAVKTDVYVEVNGKKIDTSDFIPSWRK